MAGGHGSAPGCQPISWFEGQRKEAQAAYDFVSFLTFVDDGGHFILWRLHREACSLGSS